MKITVRIFATILLAVLFISAKGQDDISFTAFADARKIVKDGYVTIAFTLSNADGSSFKAPAFKDFIVVEGPSRSIQTTIVNGRRSSEITFTYVLQPRKKGTFSIGKATIQARGKTYQTEPIKIEVVEGSITTDEKSYYVSAIPSVEEAYIGQQINLNYRLFTTVDIERYNVLEESDYAGFFATDLTRFNVRMTREVINNVQYITKNLKSISIYPQQTGDLTISSMRLQLEVVSKDRKLSYTRFSRPVKRVIVSTEPILIKVKQLPGGAPKDFSGSVGQFTLRSTVDKKNVTTNDGITITISVSGNGDVKRIQAPGINLGDEFDIYDPKVQEETSFELKGRISGKKIFSYLVAPKVAGTYNLQAQFTYFDPDSNKYVTIKDAAHKLTVKQGFNEAKPAEGNEYTETIETVKPLKTSLSLQKRGLPVWGSLWHVLLLIGPFAGLLVIWANKQLSKQKDNIDPAEKRRIEAQKIAKARLDKAYEFLEKKDSRNFYDESSKAMLDYVSSKLEINRSSLSKDNVRQKLIELEVGDDKIERFMRIIQNCELALFGGRSNAEAMQETYDDALIVLVDIEEGASKL